MPYDYIKAAPTYLPFQSDITFDVSGTATNTYFNSSGVGSAFGAISGYVLNNEGSSTNALINFISAGQLLNTLTVAPGQYQSFFGVGADRIDINGDTTTATHRFNGELHTVLNANPM